MNYQLCRWCNQEMHFIMQDIYDCKNHNCVVKFSSYYDEYLIVKDNYTIHYKNKHTYAESYSFDYYVHFDINNMTVEEIVDAAKILILFK